MEEYKMMKVKYKRVLILNDDDTEADFFSR